MHDTAPLASRVMQTSALGQVNIAWQQCGGPHERQGLERGDLKAEMESIPGQAHQK